MQFSACYRLKGGCGTGRLRHFAVFLGLAAFLAGGCIGAPEPRPMGSAAADPYSDPYRDPPPLQLGSDGNLHGQFKQGQVQQAGWNSDSDGHTADRIGTQPTRGVIPNRAPPGYAAAKPDLTTYLPSLQLATDGPLARLVVPSNDGPWTPDQAVLPWADFNGDLITVHNVRNSYYRTVDDYTVRLYTKTYDLRKLTSIDLIVVPFNDNPAIAHVAISFGFEDRDFLVTSVEIRKRSGQTYSAAAGFFNQYTIMYVLADEHDVVWKETTGFKCEMYVYRTKATPRQAQEIFVDVLGRANKLVHEPEFYNTVTNNCTTNLRNHVNRLLPDKVPYNYRVLLPGYAPEMAYELGLIEKKGTFEETKAAAKVNYNAYLYADDPQFSRKIRGL
jgi:hypothetical protein